MLQPCRYIKVRCPGGQPVLVYGGGVRYLTGLVVSRGVRLPSMQECRVSHCSPSPCYVTPSTAVKWDRLVDYEVVKLSKNYLVRLVYKSPGGGSEEVYAYPAKVWERISKVLLEPLAEGRQPRQQGAVLYGPPGTGKTSMAKLLADILGLEVVEFDPDKVLSKWVGETEQNASRILAQAESLEPSMVLMDDAEWATMEREKVMASGGGGEQVYTGLMKILLKRIESWYKGRRQVIAIVTTNVSEENLDSALKRSGRLGKPIFVPLPDVEAVSAVMQAMGVDRAAAEKWAVRIVNAGLSMADAVAVARELLAGVEPVIEPKVGVGYKRYIPVDLPPTARRLLRELNRYYMLSTALRLRTGVKSILHVALPEPVAIPLAVSLVGYELKYPVVIATDPRYIDDAIQTAETTEGFLVLPSETMPEDAQLLAYSKATRLVFAGRTHVPRAYAAPIVVPRSMHSMTMMEVNRGLAEIVLAFYQVRYGEDDIARLANNDREKLLKKLAALGVYGGEARHVEIIPTDIL